MPLVTALHLDIELLTANFWVWPANQFLIHQLMHPSNPCHSSLESKDVMWDSVKCFAQVHVDDISCFSLIYQPCNPVKGLHQFLQAQLAPSEAILAVTNQTIQINIQHIHSTYSSEEPRWLEQPHISPKNLDKASLTSEPFSEHVKYK